MEVNVHHAKTHLSRLIQRAEEGEEVIIARDGKPAVKLVPVSPETPEENYRIPGRLKGKLNLPENWEEEWKLIDKELEELMNDEPLMSEAPPGMDRWGNRTK
jgi:prevent-host-death family protein